MPDTKHQPKLNPTVYLPPRGTATPTKEVADRKV